MQEVIRERDRISNDLIANAILSDLSETGILPTGEPFNPKEFSELQQRVNQSFTVSQSSITTLMARVLFGIVARCHPQQILCVGCYQGNSLVWLAAAADMSTRIIGLDLSAPDLSVAESNFEAIGLSAEFKCLDGHDASDVLSSPLDLCLIDVDDSQNGKTHYLSLVKAIYPNLRRGAIVLAHDACLSQFYSDLKPYLAFVRDQNTFQTSTTLAIDPYGLEVSVR